jgi:hypothetical protein
MKRLLWLDDIRNPHTADWLMCYAPSFAYGEGEVHWVKRYSEFVDWITENGLPDMICFDHDLSDIHCNKSTYKEKTGFTCAQWLVDYCIDNDKMIPDYRVQSANPVGRANIEGLLNGAIKHLTK